MLHPAASVLGAYEEGLDSWLGPAGQPVGSLQFYETDPTRGFVRGAKWDLIPGFGPQLLLWRLPPAATWGPSIHESVRRLLGRAFDWFITVEDLPEEENAITLDPELKDGDGIPAPRISYRLSENSRAALDFNVERAVEAHEAAGAVETIVSRMHADCGWHLMGTARIGIDPLSSVCDPFGRTHDVPNLFVADGSIFVTAGAMNPDGDDLRLRAAAGRAHRRDGPAAGVGRMSPEARATLAGLADVLVPSADGMPSASEIGVHERWVDRAIAARPELADRLEAVLAVAAGRDPEAEIARLQAEEDEEFRMLLLVVTNAYYLSPKVRRLIRYPGQRAVEVFADQAEHDLRDGILDPVIARGSVWRVPPEPAQAAGASGSETANVAPPPGVGE